MSSTIIQDYEGVNINVSNNYKGGEGVNINVSNNYKGGEGVNSKVCNNSVYVCSIKYNSLSCILQCVSNNYNNSSNTYKSCEGVNSSSDDGVHCTNTPEDNNVNINYKKNICNNYKGGDNVDSKKYNNVCNNYNSNSNSDCDM